MKRLLLIFAAIMLTVLVFPISMANAESAGLLPAEKFNPMGEIKWGFINDSGSFVIQPKFDYVKDFNSKGIAIAGMKLSDSISYESSNVYFIDTTGKVVLGPIYTDNTYSENLNFNNGYAVIYEAGKGSTLIDEDAKVVLKTKYRIEGVSEDIVRFSDQAGSSTKYGFMDTLGKILIAPKFCSAKDFKEGKAWVEPTQGKYNLIDKTGNILQVSDSLTNISSESGSIFPFMDEATEKYGYMNKEGEVLIQPKYEDAGEFVDGTAVVTVAAADNETKKALIDTKGDYIINPEYSSIYSLGNDLYAVTSEGYEWNYSSYPNAIFDNAGKKLSDFVYFNLQQFNGDYASACNQTQTFFIDKTGKIVETLPKLDGIGTLEFVGDIINANIGNSHSYLKKDGSLIWRQDDIKYSFSGGIKVKNHYDRINYFTDVEYPEIFGISDKATQDNINAEIKKLFLTSQAPEEPSDEPENADATDSTTYTVNINKNLLLIEKTGYYFPTGAAHGMPSDETYHIDLKTGAVYQLKNLFKSNSKFTERLTALVAKQIQLNLKITDESLAYTYFDTKPAVGENIGFRINKDCLSVYFAPYDIAAYACGFVTFNIPYGQISDIIDAKSAFWNSFDKIIKNSKINLIGDISDSLSTQIQNAMKNYETQIISAINTNDFKKVEPTLLKDSSLYTSQKKLVSDLFKKGIKESLGSYDIYAIGYSYNEDVFKVYTTESIAVKTPPSKSYITKKFSWCYSVKVDTKTKTCKLCKIEKW